MKRLAARQGRRLRGALAVIAGAGLIAAAGPASAIVAATDWPAYLDGPGHGSFNAADTAITPANAASLVLKWHASGGFLSSPAVADGAVFIGSSTGEFYKIDEVTGAVLDQVFLGRITGTTCGSMGFVATATVAYDSSRGEDIVYVAAPDGYLYALSAADLSLVWRSVIAIPSTTVNDYFDWSSPTVANGNVYVGIASQCDKPLIRGGVAGYNQATGKQFATFYTVRRGHVGGSVWSSVAVDASGYVYATTGNQPSGQSPLSPAYKYTLSIVKLDPRNLKVVASFQIPQSDFAGDSDFGGSPTIFGPYVGACNKNGIYYTLLRSTMALAWKTRIGAKSTSSTPAQCSAAAGYDGTYLYIAGPATTIGATSYPGSIRRVDPTTGTFLWQTGLPDGVVGSPTLNGGGVIGVGTYDTTAPSSNGVFLVNASTGQIDQGLLPGDLDFAQNVFAGGMLFAANGTGLYGYGL
jgi:outer membrane protein assembly factor BamB